MNYIRKNINVDNKKLTKNINKQINENNIIIQQCMRKVNIELTLQINIETKELVKKRQRKLKNSL